MGRVPLSPTAPPLPPKAEPNPALTFHRQKMISARRSSPPRMLPTRIQREMGTRFPWMISSTICGKRKEETGMGGVCPALRPRFGGQQGSRGAPTSL